MRDIYQLLQKQALPLESKIRLSMMRIRAWYTHWDGEVQWACEGTGPGIALRNLVVDDCMLDIQDPAPGDEPRNLIVPTLVGDDPTLIDSWLTHGCNAYEADPPTCSPLSVWTDEDVERYIKNR